MNIENNDHMDSQSVDVALPRRVESALQAMPTWILAIGLLGLFTGIICIIAAPIAEINATWLVGFSGLLVFGCVMLHERKIETHLLASYDEYLASLPIGSLLKAADDPEFHHRSRTRVLARLCAVHPDWASKGADGVSDN